MLVAEVYDPAASVKPVLESGKPFTSVPAILPQAKVAVTTEASVPLDGIRAGVAETSSAAGPGWPKLKLTVPSETPPVPPPFPGVARKVTAIAAALTPVAPLGQPASGLVT